MKYRLTILSFFFSFMLFAQHEDERFLNEILVFERSHNCDSILILQEKSNIQFTETNLNALKLELPGAILDELIVKNKDLRKTKSPWNVTKINGAKGVTTKDSLGFTIYNDFAVSDSLFKAYYHLDTITNWVTMETKIDSLNKLGVYSSDFSSLPNCYRYTSIYSYPLISGNGKWAIIEQVKYVRSLHASGAIIICKRKNGKWKIVGYTCQWVS